MDNYNFIEILSDIINDNYVSDYFKLKKSIHSNTIKYYLAIIKFNPNYYNDMNLEFVNNLYSYNIEYILSYYLNFKSTYDKLFFEHFNSNTNQLNLNF